MEFRVLVSVLLIGFIAHRGYYTRKVRHAPEAVREKPKLGRMAQIAEWLALPAFASTLVYVLAPEWIAWAALPLPDGVRWAGVLVALGGFALLQWAQMTLGQNWSDAPKFFEDQALVAHGPYQWIRHPIYAGFLLILGSLLLLSANALVGGLWIALTALDVTARMDAEEALMLGQVGEPYRAYMRRTGRVFPRVGR